MAQNNYIDLPVVAFIKIAQVITDGSSGTVTFSSIPQTFSNLKIVYYAKSQNPIHFNDMGIDQIDMQFNGDTTSSYNWANMNGNNGAPNSTATTSDSQIGLPGASPSNSFSPSFAEGGELIIPGYTRTDYYKSISGTQSGSAYIFNGNFLYPDTYNFAGSWMNTDAITQIDLTIDNGNPYAAGSVFTLYGLL